MIVHANGKLNLSLDVLGRATGGYHDLRMVMQSVAFGDDLDISLTEDGSFYIDPGQRYLPKDEKNLALRAARLFLEGTGLGARIRVTKRLPVCAGLGGGSADAAAVLVALNRMTGAGKTTAELCEMGLQLGSDVPFCVRGGTALAEGRGEKLTPLPALPDCPIVICKPSFAISTPELFGRIDARRSRLRPDTRGLLAALEQQDLYGVARRMYNVFEDVLDRRQSAVPAIKRQLIDLGAVNAVMTGTGSAVFGLFDDERTARDAVDALSPAYQSCVLTRPAGAGCVCRE
ncbi:MAG: 4-(cytidine 5'-diphospho)-2-C-methyl-D-erythritol kinase [Oscillospiraceae bacterium]|nr:4-(cytidine 5'-diphospho)-2-C-methyl-D-erythritol kinase [Oscillospiraceae bacterium]